MHREDVRAPEQLILLDAFDALGRSVFWGQVLAPGDTLHAKGETDAGDCAAEAAEAQQAQRLAGDAVADPGLPSALAQELMILGDPAGRAEDQAPGEFRGILVAAAGTPGAAHGDAA